MTSRLPPEPRRVEVVESIRRVDPLTDSGALAISDAPWSGRMRGDDVTEITAAL